MNFLRKIWVGWKGKPLPVTPQVGRLSAYASRAGILAIERIVEEVAPEDWKDLFPITHLFANGVCSREMFMPKGSIVVSRVHKNACINVISQGKVSVLTESGEVMLTAPCKFVSEAGTKRVLVAYEDTVWSNFIRTDKTDPDEVLEDMTFATFEEFDRYNLTRLEN